jgi:hypothetical protein
MLVWNLMSSLAVEVITVISNAEYGGVRVEPGQNRIADRRHFEGDYCTQTFISTRPKCLRRSRFVDIQIPR